jgi:glycosyltransferase involved in cell wall biosynthesis
MMRILFLTNFYPPYALGGQGNSCQQMVESLRQRGHEAAVLTSMHGVDNQPVADGAIYRWLYLEMDFTPWSNALSFFRERGRRERHNLEAFARLAQEFAPDLIFIWGMWNLAHSLPALAEEAFPGRVVYRFAEYWPTLPSQYKLYWLAPGRRWYSRVPKWAVRQVALRVLGDGRRTPLRFEHAICVSAATRDVLVKAGIPVAQARVIHTGLDGEAYRNGAGPEEGPAGDKELRLLYAGRLTAEKGIETALAALAELVFGRGMADVRLDIAGDGNVDYTAQLMARTAQLGLENHVTFMGRVPADKMPRLMREADVLVAPSNWPEPLARVILEGMACGTAVVATPLGGTPEIMTDGHNGLLFPAGDSQALAEELAMLAADEGLRRRLAEAGQQTVKERFTLQVMLDQVEGYLEEVLAASDEPAAELSV